MKVSFEKFRTLPPSYLTEDYDGDEESEEEIEEGIIIVRPEYLWGNPSNLNT